MSHHLGEGQLTKADVATWRREVKQVDTAWLAGYEKGKADHRRDFLAGGIGFLIGRSPLGLLVIVVLSIAVLGGLGHFWWVPAAFVAWRMWANDRRTREQRRPLYEPPPPFPDEED